MFEFKYRPIWFDLWTDEKIAYIYFKFECYDNIHDKMEVSEEK